LRDARQPGNEWWYRALRIHQRCELFEMHTITANANGTDFRDAMT
jgi:hypothetical protein